MPTKLGRSPVLAPPAINAGAYEAPTPTSNADAAAAKVTTADATITVVFPIP
jgi:hypothetical protein